MDERKDGYINHCTPGKGSFMLLFHVTMAFTEGFLVFLDVTDRTDHLVVSRPSSYWRVGDGNGVFNG